MTETLRITITIAGKRFSLTVPAKDEEIYRRAADSLRKKIDEYARRAPEADESYILAQAAFYMSLRLQLLNQAHSKDMKELAEICEDIEVVLPQSQE